MIPADSFVYVRRLGRVRHHVEANLSTPIDLAAAAGIAGLEPTYFSRFFRRHVGQTFCEWVRIVRVSAAQRLLLERNYSITEVTAMVGFQTERAFQRNFKTVSGCTATEYRLLNGRISLGSRAEQVVSRRE